jgi:hypothetical protein
VDVELINAEDSISTIEAWLIVWNSITEQHINKICVRNAREEVILKFQPLFHKKTVGKK